MRSYRTYRHVALKLKPCVLLLTCFLSLPNISQGFEIKEIFSKNRLYIPASKNPSSWRVYIDKRCGAPTSTLELNYGPISLDRSKFIASSFDDSKAAFKSCDEGVQRKANGDFVFYLSYKNKTNQKVSAQKVSAKQGYYIDLWHSSEVAKRKVASKSAQKKPAIPAEINSLEELSKISNVEFRSFTNFVSPYRDSKVEKNVSLSKEPISKQELKEPILMFDVGAAELEFAEAAFPYKEYELKKIKNKPLKKSLDAIIKMSKRKDWVRASAAADVLNKSNLASAYRDLGPIKAALDGYLKLKVSKEQKDKSANLFYNFAINLWKDEIAKASLYKTKPGPFLEFIYKESLRTLFERKDNYGALSFIDDANVLEWSPSVLERSEYLRGVAVLNLGMFEKAKSTFQEYIKKRRSLSIREISDRRLLPAAAFKLGDIKFFQGDYNSALEKYEEAMTALSGSRKINLEGYLYPEGLSVFNHVLYNMAEAHIRLGDYAKALKRLRAMLSFDVEGKNKGIALFRISEVLDYLGSDKKRLLSILNECSYRYSGNLSGSLCKIKSFQFDPTFKDRRFWPRLEAEFDKFEKLNTAERVRLSNADRRVYSSIVKAAFYIENNKPLIALSTLDETRPLKSKAYLKDWNYEFSSTALLGVMREYLAAGESSTVVKTYDARKKTLLLYMNRPDVVLAVAKAYASEALWKESSQTLKEAKRIRSVLGSLANRPFNYSEQEWNYVSAQVALGLHEVGLESEKNVAAQIAVLSDDHMPSINLLISFARKVSNLPLEIKGWELKSKKVKLSWNDTLYYSSALLKAKSHKAHRRFLEDSVGSWFYEKSKARGNGGGAAPSSELLLRLADARARDKAFDSALRVFAFLERKSAEELGGIVTREMLLYKEGMIYLSKKLNDKALDKFNQSSTLAPDSVWSRLSRLKVKEIELNDQKANANAR